MIAIRGFNSSLAQAFLPLLPKGEQVVPVERGTVDTEALRHVFAQGIIRPKKVVEQSAKEIEQSLWVNAMMTIEQCEMIFAANAYARVLVIGSESGFAGSFDGTYAAAKAAVHRYVETKKLRSPGQQLICIAPSIMGDSGMTLARADKDSLVKRVANHPKARFLTLAEVASLMHHVLYIDTGYLSGVVIRMNGGQHIR